MKKLLVLILIVAACGAAAAAVWWRSHLDHADGRLALHGNLDLRQVLLPFNNSERIAEVLVQEGDRVTRGQVLARLDTSRLTPQVARAVAEVAAQSEVVLRLHNGSRPEEIAEARANVESARADALNARQQYARLTTLSARSQGGAVSQQEVDNAKAALDMAEAKVVVSQKVLDLALAGPRKEEVAEAEARLRSLEAQLALLRQQLADTQLLAPTDSVVRTRIMEPGEMASPQRPVFLLAITDPKWVRAYVSEPDLGKVRSGMTAEVAVDSFPDRRFEGWIGFISPVAEFTPKTVQTEELRTSLVYEVRVFVKDPSDDLRLGMPATVYLSAPPDESASPPSTPSTAGQRQTPHAKSQR